LAIKKEKIGYESNRFYGNGEPVPDEALNESLK